MLILPPKTELKGSARTLAAITLLLVLTSVFLLTFCIQTARSEDTIVIRADGLIDPPTARIQRSGDVYTFEGNIFGSINVQRNDIILDGKGNVLQGNGTGRAIQASNTNNVTIQNMKIVNYSAGIYIGHSMSNKIINNTIGNCTYGILPDFAPNTEIVNNTITGNEWDGIFAISSPNSVIINNTITNQGKWGIYLGDSKDTKLRGNLMRNNRFNFGVSTNFILDVDTSNTVDGKPVYFWVNQRDRQVPLDAGFVAVVNSVGIVVRGLALNRNGQGVALANSEDCIIEDLTVTANGYFGVYLVNSNFNTIRNNNIAGNDWGGIALVSSTGNTVSNNTIEDLDKSILLQESNGNTINANIMRDNEEGPYLVDSSNNIITGNTIEGNGVGIYLYESSNDNSIYHNNFVNNTQQVYIRDSVSGWDDGYPSGGNYWSDYKGTDKNRDGKGDTPYILDQSNRDNYPFINPIQKVSYTPQTNLYSTTNTLEIASIIAVATLAYITRRRIKNRHSTLTTNTATSVIITYI